MVFSCLAAVMLMGLVGCAERPGKVAAAVPAEVSFNEHVRPILTQNCTACHGGVKTAGGVSFIYSDTALGKSESGKQIITPGEPSQSELYRRITAESVAERMPPAEHGAPLSAGDIAIMEKWIREGAKWEEHWSYIAPQPHEAPEVEDGNWAQGDIDRFVLAAMQEHGLSPNPEASKAELLRRVSLDLIGLPPSIEELDAFENSSEPDAFEREVDRLLASPRFGERWASPWLDLARYADTSGFERDPERQIWGYRDWVVRAINTDMPFDAFTVAQLAGDQLEDPSLDDLVATAFHRNTKTNVEGGTDDEEYRLAAVMDRVSTTWQAWMGTTFGCVQCHSHPYDPFPHESYYEFLAYFDNTQDHDLKDDFPTIDYAIEESDRQRAYELRQGIEKANIEYTAPFQNLSQHLDWSPLRYVKAESTQGVVFSIERDEKGREVLQTGPNAPKGTVHTIEARVSPMTVQALRIDAPMQDGATVDKPGNPYILSYLEAKVKTKAGEEEAIVFKRVIADEANPRLWPERSLVKKDSQGWGEYPKQHYARWAVFVLEKPLEIPAEATVEITIHNLAGHDGAQMPVMRRFRFSASDDPRWAELSASAAVAKAESDRELWTTELEDIELSSVPIARERMAGFERVSKVFIRGDWISKGETVTPAVPQLMRPEDTPVPESRLELAEWIASPENPLTSRFAVNRYWEQLFGRGIVETLEDFGSPGTPPTHPELLDDLAVRFSGALGWSRKAMIREMVLSSTYRQSATVAPEAAEKDPRNLWLSRATRKRLTAEMARDTALAVSGLLSDKMYGPPVMPLQPEGVWRVVYNNKKWITSEGEDRYRRALYTYWKRSATYPSFISFDAPSRDTCMPRRISTNTPLQALVTLNDPVYYECAAHLAERALHEGGTTPDEQIGWAYRAALLKEASPETLASFLALFEEVASEPDGDEAKAMTYVCSAMLNLDDYLTR